MRLRLDVAVELAEEDVIRPLLADFQRRMPVGGIPAADTLMLDLSIDTYNTDDAQMAVRAGAAFYEALLRGDAPPNGDAGFRTEYTGR